MDDQHNALRSKDVHEIPPYLLEYYKSFFDTKDKDILFKMISQIREKCLEKETVARCDSEIIRKNFVGEVARHAFALPYKGGGGQHSMEEYIERLTRYLFDEMSYAGFSEGGFDKIKEDKELYASIKIFL